MASTIADPLLRADDEPTLVRRASSGDHAAFAALMRRHNRRLYRLARASLRDATEAEDALQDAYLHAYRSLAGFRGECALSTWLTRLVLNECLQRRRRSLRRGNVVTLVSADAAASHAAQVAEDELRRPERGADRAQLRDILELKVAQLPDAYRVVFVLRAVEEQSVAETAEALGITPETVRSRYFRARGLLRESLARDVDIVERDLFEFGGQRCDRLVARVLARL
ncbi:MAG: RNA polymerase sigma factor [Proteobacteria bacterium]|nr:RNA polymerase sigma factor [Pseudomonadota bacterium]